MLNTAHIHIILVRPHSPGNIGAVARAMHNMGLERLVLVAPERFPHHEARMMACDAVALLHQAQIVPTLAEAVTSCHWLVGTSARRRQYRKPPLSPAALAHRLPALCQQYQVGMVFGPEDAKASWSEGRRPYGCGNRQSRTSACRRRLTAYATLQLSAAAEAGALARHDDQDGHCGL